LSASQLYLSASIWCRERELNGMAAWMLEESCEKRGHGLALLEFAMKMRFPVLLKELPPPPRDWQSVVEVWEDVLDAQQTNTQNLLNLAAAANRCGEYGAAAFLDPFHVEQIEAEDKVGAALARVRTASHEILYLLDYELGREAAEEQCDHDDDYDRRH